MTSELQLLATASTLANYHRLKVSPYQISGLLRYCRRGDAQIKISVAAERPEVRFTFPEADGSWPLRALQQCAVPSVFCFGKIQVCAQGERIEIDVQRFLAGAPEETRLPYTVVDTDRSVSLTVSLHSQGDAWLSPPKIREELKKNTWVGAHASASPRKVDVRCIGIDESIRQPTASKDPVIGVLSVPGGELYIRAFAQVADANGGSGRIRHIGDSFTSCTGDLVKVPKGIAIDVEFDVYAHHSGDPINTTGAQDFELTRTEMSRWIQRLIDSNPCQRLCEQVRRTSCERALVDLEHRRQKLKVCNYVYFGRTLVYQQPANENQLVALFLKLEAMKALPFDCSVLEFTARKGIDAIGHFRLSTSSILEQYAPIEFENEFQSFITHGHPPEHAKLIICWSAEVGRGRKLATTDRDWLRVYEVAGLKIPVVIVSKFPNIRNEALNG